VINKDTIDQLLHCSCGHHTPQHNTHRTARICSHLELPCRTDKRQTDRRSRTGTKANYRKAVW